jgi:ribosomal protein L11 methylase PrmA
MKSMTGTAKVLDPASFRDPSGFVFKDQDGTVLRQVNPGYEPHYRQLMDGGLYQSLTDAGLMLPHEELTPAAGPPPRLLRPQQLSFISYPYEWSFSQYQDAALLTLEIQRRALDHDMILKDASAYNVQFDSGRPVFIDTLSFETYSPGAPWVAYAQFCRHFLAPLALMSYTDIRLQRMMETHLDGIPLDLAAQLLPWYTRARPALLVHLFLHAWMQQRYASTSDKTAARPARTVRISSAGMRGMIDGLHAAIRKLRWRPEGTEWADYYSTCSYDVESIEEKKQVVASLLDRANPKTVWDLGANTGLFSSLAAEKGAATIAFDIDPACIERCYLECRKQSRDLLPLRIDLTNPSPALGWAGKERRSLSERGPVDLLLMLAVIHHLAIANNLPFGHVADFARFLCTWLIIEFVPKDDPQVQRLLSSREDIFTDYTQESFEAEFGKRFDIIECQPVGRDGRALYLLRAKLT